MEAVVAMICSDEIFSSLTDRREKVIEIISAICALLNSDGGKVVLTIDIHGKPGKRMFSPRRWSSIIRILEQTMVSIIGTHQTFSNISFLYDEKKLDILIEKAASLITTHYNLYLPSQTQVMHLPATEPLDMIRGIMNRKNIPQAIEPGCHQKTFLKGGNCGSQESKMEQFKCLKSKASERTTLADRITGKGNKFICYVSAFANYSGGHIYYGITDDGVVEGQFISSEEDKNDVTKKVEKAINKMIWPEHIGQPERGEHWEISFEPVLDKNSKPIQSTFVIVIYIAPCPGGVFTEEPECYEMVEGKVEKMSFVTWKRKNLRSDDVLTNKLECCGAKEEKVENSIVTRRKKSEAPCTCQQQIPRAPDNNSIIWTSQWTRQICIKAFCILTVCLNNADWKGFSEQSRKIEDEHPEIVEIKLMILLKKIVARGRKHEFNEANRLLQEYEHLLPTCTEKRIFELLGLYVKAALSRSSGALDCNTRDLLVNALAKAEWVLPGLVTAIINIFAGTITDRLNDEFQSNCLCPPDVLSVIALQHLKQFVDCPITRADLEHKAHIILATFYLGFNLSGQLVANHVDKTYLKYAESSVEAVKQSIKSGNKFTRYRESQFNLVKSILHFRYSESGSSEILHLKDAFQFSKSAEMLARKCKYHEVLSWSKSLQALYAEKLVRIQLRPRPHNAAGI